MMQSQTVCDHCGLPATNHRSTMAGGELVMEHMCSACIEAQQGSKDTKKRRRGQGVVLLAVGLFILLNSLLADILRFGKSAGFGVYQWIGLILAAFLLLVGSLVRVPAIIVSALAIGGLSLLADWLHFGSGAGFGKAQSLGCGIGLIMVLTGLAVARLRR